MRWNQQELSSPELVKSLIEARTSQGTHNQHILHQLEDDLPSKEMIKKHTPVVSSSLITNSSNVPNGKATQSEHCLPSTGRDICYITIGRWRKLRSSPREICLNPQAGLKFCRQNRKVICSCHILLMCLIFWMYRSASTEYFVIFWRTANSAVCTIRK